MGDGVRFLETGGIGDAEGARQIDDLESLREKRRGKGEGNLDRRAEESGGAFSREVHRAFLGSVAQLADLPREARTPFERVALPPVARREAQLRRRMVGEDPRRLHPRVPRSADHRDGESLHESAYLCNASRDASAKVSRDQIGGGSSQKGPSARPARTLPA